MTYNKKDLGTNLYKGRGKSVFEPHLTSKDAPFYIPILYSAFDDLSVDIIEANNMIQEQVIDDSN
jgi:hypothetical protein